MAGRVALYPDGISGVLGLHKAGKVRIIAVTSATRSPDLPDVPTMVELGFPDFIVTNWFALFGLTGTPPDIINRLNAEIVKISKLPESVKRVELDGTSMISSTPQELRDMLSKEIGIWRKVVTENNITSEE